MAEPLLVLVAVIGLRETDTVSDTVCEPEDAPLSDCEPDGDAEVDVPRDGD